MNASNAQHAVCWAVVPAAGVGQRMHADVPKQYLHLAGLPILQHSIQRLLAHPSVQGVVVALAAEDEYFETLHIESDKPIIRVTGGEQRCHSVLSALEYLLDHANGDDWVLVHDAARPCLRLTDLDQLIDTVMQGGVGGLLAVPVHDTIKRQGEDGAVVETVNREDLWHAQTPQMFRLAELHCALAAALDAGLLVTDESSAMEHMGYCPVLVEGHADNLKVTRPEDLPLTEFFLRRVLEQGEGKL